MSITSLSLQARSFYHGMYIALLYDPPSWSLRPCKSTKDVLFVVHSRPHALLSAPRARFPPTIIALRASSSTVRSNPESCPRKCDKYLYPQVCPRATHSIPSEQFLAMAAINKTLSSWEIGTLAEALTEYEWPHLAVFAPGSIPPPAHLRKGEAADVLSIAKKCA